MNIQLFDKIVSLTFARSDGKTAAIICPQTGRKPTIRISGEILPALALSNIAIRVTNFVTDIPLWQYTQQGGGGHCTVSAGYANGLHAAFYGEVLNAYQELPGPDGVTCFEFMNGSFSDWTTKTITARYEGGVSLKAALEDVAEKLEMSLLYFADPGLVIPSMGLQLNGLAKEMLEKIVYAFAVSGQFGDWEGLTIRPDGQNLIVTNRDLGTGITYQLSYVSMVNHTGGSFEIQAPWVPSIRCDDLVMLDPLFLRQSIASSFVKATGNTFKVMSMRFDFCTTDDTNLMTLTTIDTGAISKVHTYSIPPRVVKA